MNTRQILLEEAFNAAVDFIDAHVANPDLTREVAEKHRVYQEKKAELEVSRQQSPAPTMAVPSPESFNFSDMRLKESPAPASEEALPYKALNYDSIHQLADEYGIEYNKLATAMRDYQSKEHWPVSPPSAMGELPPYPRTFKLLCLINEYRTAPPESIAKVTQGIVDEIDNLFQEYGQLCRQGGGVTADKVEGNDLDLELAKSYANSALQFLHSFDPKEDGQKAIDWRDEKPWYPRLDLGRALDHIEDLAAVVLNLAERVIAPEDLQTIDDVITTADCDCSDKRRYEWGEHHCGCYLFDLNCLSKQLHKGLPAPPQLTHKEG